MKDFTIKACYRHFVKKDGDGEWIYTTRLYACDHVAVMATPDVIFVTGFLNNDTRAFEDTVPNHPLSADAGKSKEVCTEIIVENAHGKTTQHVRSPRVV